MALTIRAYRRECALCDNEAMQKLSIVIPAYNEQEAIRSIIERTLAAAPRIIQKAGVESVEVIVVSDGSKDRTAEIAKEFADRGLIHLISYPKNRGYGAAIITGFEASSGDLVSFLDADGTCDPLLFIEFLRKMNETNADIVIGGRLHANSRMPATRRVGNILYRNLVNAIGSSSVSDVASGMRVLKKSILHKLYPLPDGLHFTPAMSVRAILDRDIRIEEVPIPYEERIGSSKLRIIQDGIGFLKTILEIAFTYKPLRLFGVIGILFLLPALFYGIPTLIHYIEYRNVPEDRIYRLIFVVVAAVSGVQMISLGLITQTMTNLAHNYEMNTAVERMLDKAFLRKLGYIGLLFLIAALALNVRAIAQYVTTAHIQVHWSYVVSGGLLVLLGFQLLAFSIIHRIIHVLKEQKKVREQGTLQE